MPDPTQDELLRAVGGPAPEALERLIYVAGSARGGTSITQAIIGMHDNVLALDGPSSFLSHVWRYRHKVHERLWRQLLWTPHYLRRAAVRDSLPRARSRAYDKLINRAVAEKDLHNLFRLYPLTRALDPDETRDPASFVAWLDKGNDFWGVDRLADAFPEARFVFVLRDPRGAVASLAKRAADLRPDTEFRIEPRDIIEMAIHWRNLVRQEVRFARRHPRRTILLRFEDLTARPVEMTRGLYAALDLPAIPDDALRRRLDAAAYVSSNDGADRGKGISTAPNERWKKSLDPLALDLIAEICGRSARALGYDVPQPARRRGPLGIAALVPGVRNRLAVLAKLAFLAFVEGRGAARAGTAPLRLPAAG